MAENFADGSTTRLAYVVEATPGVTPAEPEFQNLRFTGESLNHSRENITSDEIRPDRNTPDLTQVGGQAGGGVDFELSYETFDDFMAGALQSAWDTDVIKNAVTRKYFTLEKTFRVGPTERFARFTGMEVDSFAITATARQQITGSLSFLGRGGGVGDAIITGATYLPSNSKPVENGASGFGGITMQGLTETPVLMSAGFTLNNNLRARPQLGSVDLAGTGSGRCEVTGTLEAYFDTWDLYQRFLDGESSSLSFTVGLVSGEKYTFAFPNIKFETGEIVAGGNDQDVMASMSWRALLDQTEQASIKITRGVT